MSDVISIEDRMDKVRADFAARKEEWLRDTNSAAEYLRMVFLYLMQQNRVERVIAFDEEGEVKQFYLEQDDMYRHAKAKSFMDKIDELIGYLYDIDGVVGYKLIRSGQSTCILYCLFDSSNAPEEIIFDYRYSDDIEDALDFASQYHSSTRKKTTGETDDPYHE
tara:strand:- start:2813 stop:3304 length:492 start_codon:yes stop_codon:yes gene_type:complete